MFVLYGLCFIILIGNNYALKDTIHKKNVEFVEILKQDLTRNNDDYADMRRSLSQTENILQSVNNANINDVRYKIITTRDNKKVTKTHNNNNDDKEDSRLKIIDKIKRRVNDALQSKEIINNNNGPQRRTGEIKDERNNITVITLSSNNSEVPLNNDHDQHNISDVNQPRPRSLWSDMHNMFLNSKKIIKNYKIKLFPNTTKRVMVLTTTLKTVKLKKHRRHRKKTRLERFKKFMMKDKGYKIKDSIRDRNQEPPVTSKTPADIPQNTKKKPKVWSARDIKHLLRQALNYKIYNNTDTLTELPNADMLDMLPAKGGRIHSKRVNGHLCQRHVLIPEGPKYNSLGEIYLPPHASARIAHEYNVTALPRLLLPKCCNCCHKSVLGCE